ncbi:PREDICTED: NADH dehydrogenase [ubiquinone] 1 beta subcomplex subunit 6-like [Lipotes vexillifer]|uniref:NADH dehydrogenase [ubiquinone] 1 beta subcomplex subunit 6 n=1 Tax=Lipotes vexillifer TaxID=118797 RepID=A0A340WJ74_LIPVE|nr:PREDICTED: NADH dehydrogenase [ubiquinone] 1 beta subcomplex subunit 6-like [Lipotes vexillifer]
MALGAGSQRPESRVPLTSDSKPLGFGDPALQPEGQDRGPVGTTFSAFQPTHLQMHRSTGCPSHEKLRPQQLRELRRRRLKDQELIRRVEPLLPRRRVWPMKQFWNKFLQDRAPWKNVIYKTYRHSIFAFTHVLAPVWIIHYYLKYHVNIKPYAIVERKPRIFLGDTILETGEVIPPRKEFPDQHHGILLLKFQRCLSPSLLLHYQTY